MAQLKITETVLRDSHQSLIATRMTTEEMLPILEQMDKVGYHSLEAWGGATFDACMRYLNEDPWERLRTIRAHVKNTKLQMLFRGQNILGYRHYSDDVVAYFVQKCIANGIDIIRIFDALNDPRNLKTAIDATKREGGHVQAAFSYTTGPVYTMEYYAKYAKQLEEMGADSICIKDMAGLLKPYDAYELVKTLKASTSLPVQLHTHYTAGLASMTLLKAAEAGVDIVDTAISPMAMGTSQPPTEAFVAAMQGTPYDTGLDLAELNKISKHFAPLREKYLASGQLNPKALAVDVNALLYQVPGGMLSNLMKQLADAGRSQQLTEVLEEVPRVRADVGYPPLVTPSSQIVGTQAVYNVIMGERYKTVTKEFKDIVLGKYGKTPMEIDPAFAKRIVGDAQRITYRPADDLAPELEAIRARIPAGLVEQDEDVLSFALFEQIALKFFEYRKNQKYGVDANADAKSGIHTV
ncbi:MAG: oxaloacetate decarboxylase subunit alpha [Ruminococcaceae bacterium]|nr:oxaloacetate decarboxylase subunit alpha [Oscillospiraceae bacterium]